MRILQYEGLSRLSQCTRFFTWNRTTHTAIEFDDGRVCEAWKCPEQDGVRIVESLHAQHTPGTRVKAYTIPDLSPGQVDDLTSWLMGQEGKPYAFWGGITRFLTRRDPQPYDPQTFRIENYDPRKWFCSCLGFAGLMHVDFSLLDRIPPWRVSPGHINLSPRLKLDEILCTGNRTAGFQPAGGKSPLRKRHFRVRPCWSVAPLAVLCLLFSTLWPAIAKEPPTPVEMEISPPDFPVPVIGTNEAGGLILSSAFPTNPPPPVVHVTNTVYIIPSNTVIRIQVRDRLDSGDWFEPVIFKSRTDYKFFRVLFQSEAVP